MKFIDAFLFCVRQCVLNVKHAYYWEQEQVQPKVKSEMRQIRPS